MAYSVAGIMMIEPTESESLLAELDRCCEVIISIRQKRNAIVIGAPSVSAQRHAKHD